MRRKKKMMVIFMLSLGGVACVCSLVRMAYILDYSEATDLTWDAFEPCLWGHLEVALAIIAACCPALRPLFARMMPDLGGSGRSRPSRDRTGSRLSSDLFGAGVGAHQSSKGTWTTRASVDGVKLGGNSGLWGHDRGGSDAMLVEEVELGNASVNRKGLEGLQNANVVRGS